MATVAALALVAALPATAAAHEPPPAYPLVFPVAGDHHYTDTYGAPRDSGARSHTGIDIIAAKLTPVVAAATGTVGWLAGEQGYDCCAMAIDHDDGWSTWYIHLNNDTPGTDDGLGWGFADGIGPGVRVEAGQLIAWVGDSGNAEHTVAHLHFELHDSTGTPVNPYPHLLAAEASAAPPPTPSAGTTPLATASCEPGRTCDGIALVDGVSRFQLRHPATAAAATQFFYGEPGDVALMGDWDCDGLTTPAMYRPGNGFMYLRNSNDFGVADIEYFYGEPDDIPLAGDFDGDGYDTLAIYRPDEARVYVRNSLGTGAADHAYYFGQPGDVPFAGDFDGDGTDTIGLHRPTTGFVYFRNRHSQGVADHEFFYGEPGDVLVAGDWDGDGIDTVAVYRPEDQSLHIKNSNELGPADHHLEVGDFVFAAAMSAPVEDVA